MSLLARVSRAAGGALSRAATVGRHSCGKAQHQPQRLHSSLVCAGAARMGVAGSCRRGSAEQDSRGGTPASGNVTVTPYFGSSSLVLYAIITVTSLVPSPPDSPPGTHILLPSLVSVSWSSWLVDESLPRYNRQERDVSNVIVLHITPSFSALPPSPWSGVPCSLLPLLFLP